jgi:hypothetical protein
VAGEQGRDIQDGDTFDVTGGNPLETAENLADFATDGCLEGGGYDIFASLVPPAALIEETERLSDARRVAEEDLQEPAAARALLGFEFLEQGVRTPASTRVAFSHRGALYAAVHASPIIGGRARDRGPGSLPGR